MLPAPFTSEFVNRLEALRLRTHKEVLGSRPGSYSSPRRGTSLEFARFVYEQDDSGQTLTLDDLLVLNKLFYERDIDSELAGRLIQKGVSEARRVLSRLHERGLIEGKGEKKGRGYHLSAGLYVRIRDIDPIRQERLVMEFVQVHGKITRGELMRLLGVSAGQARRVLRRMKRSGKIEPQGTPPRWIYYIAKQ